MFTDDGEESNERCVCSERIAWEENLKDRQWPKILDLAVAKNTI